MKDFVVKKFPLATDLSSISGFLRERGIQHRIYEEAGEQVLTVDDMRMAGPITQFLREVEQGRLVIQAEPTETGAAAAKNGKVKVVGSLPTNIWRFPVTLGLALLSVAGALLVWLDRDASYWLSFQALGDYEFLSLRETLAQGQVWRLITPAFLHFSLFHVLFNCMWLWDLGRRLELLLGRFSFLLFFVVVAGVSNIAQYLWQPGVNFGGMSGVVYGVLGFIMVSHRFEPRPITAVPPVVIGSMLFWMVLCINGTVDVFTGGNIANAAHVGGLLAGCLLAFLRKIKPSSFV